MGKMRVGVSIIKQLSDAFYGHKKMVLEELISNAYDAYAGKVDIITGPDSIRVVDDGAGMSAEELVKFFYISYTEKQKKPAKEIKNKLKRYIIGKFGIGKLSMYQLCHQFRIVAWKEGVRSEAFFDFDRFEEREFVDEIELEATSSKDDQQKHGTEITLQKLRDSTEIEPNELRRYLGRRLFFNPDFEVLVDGIAVAGPEYREAVHEIKVHEVVPGVGLVSGIIKYLSQNLAADQSGIYVRIKGRVINHNPRIIDFSQLSAPMVMGRRIWGFLEVNDLEEALLSNRSGFIEDHPKWKKFIAWLKKFLNSKNKIANTIYSERNVAKESEVIPETFKGNIEKRISALEKEDLKIAKQPIKKELQKSTRSLSKVKIEIVKISAGGPEAVFEENTSRILINSDHPLYITARKRHCLEYHVMKATIVALAAAISSSVPEFLENYDKLSRSDEIPKIKRR